MKRFKKLMAILMATALIMSIAAISASAYNPVNGDAITLSFNKFLIVDNDARIPAIEFEYAIAPGSAIAATANTPAIIAGVGTPTIGTASFPSGDTTYNTVQTGDAVTLDSGEKYAKKTVTVDFSSVSFSEPGIYRYVITEDMTNAANKAVSYDTQTNGTAGTRYLDVYVEDVNGALVVSQYVMHDTAAIPNVQTDGAPAADKSSGFVNEITSHELSFGKEVTGNQGSKDKYFKYTLTISNAQANTTYEVDLTNAEAAPTKTDATKYTTMSRTVSISPSRVCPKDIFMNSARMRRITPVPTVSQPQITQTTPLIPILLSTRPASMPISRPALPTTAPALSPRAFC